MEDRTIVESSCSAVINAPIEAIDIPNWCFTLPDHEYQGCSPAHVGAGSTTSRDGQRLSINVEVIGGSLMVQHYVASRADKDHLTLESISDLFTPTGRTTIEVLWELSAKPLAGGRCEFTNRVRSRATDDLWNFLARQGIPFELFRSQRLPFTKAHNEGETPLFAASIERHALARRAAA